MIIEIYFNIWRIQYFILNFIQIIFPHVVHGYTHQFIFESSLFVKIMCQCFKFIFAALFLIKLKYFLNDENRHDNKTHPRPDPACPVPNLTGKSRFNKVRVWGKFRFLVQGPDRSQGMLIPARTHPHPAPAVWNLPYLIL